MKEVPLGKDYSALEKVTILRFLARMEQYADRGKVEAMAERQIDTSNMHWLTQFQYWKNVSSGFRWASSLINPQEVYDGESNPSNEVDGQQGLLGTTDPK